MKDIKIFLKKKKTEGHKGLVKDFIEEEKEKKRQYYRERYRNHSEDQKQNLVKYGRNPYLTFHK